MSLPLCPACGNPDLPRVDSAAEIRLAEEDSPVRYTVAVHRGYRCPCGWSYHTTELITAWNPATVYVRKFGADERKIPDSGRGVPIR